MKLDKVLQVLVPKEHKFYALYEESVETLVLSAELLISLIKTEEIGLRGVIIKKIKEAEHLGDKSVQNIQNELNKTFITPFDRDDMFMLSNAIDDVIDIINGIAQRIDYLKPKDFLPEIFSIAESLLLACHEIKTAVFSSRDLVNSKRIKENCKRIKLIEKETDIIYRQGIVNLLNTETDLVELIKKKEILEVMEESIDLAEDVSDVICTIIVKNAL